MCTSQQYAQTLMFVWILNSLVVYQLAAGGADKCNPVSVTAFTTLLAAAGPCEQQDSADAMIDLAKTLNNDADMIKFAQIFAQQPRNTVRVFALRCVRRFTLSVCFVSRRKPSRAPRDVP